MPSVARMLFIGLAVQVFLASAGSLTRSAKKDLKHVDADGTIMSVAGPTHMAPSASSLMAMSMSDSGHMEEFDMPEMSSDDVAELKVQKLLESLQGMARSGVAPETDKITTIKAIVQDELLPDLTTQHDACTKQVKTNLEAIDTCNSNAVATLTGITSGAEAAVGTAKTAHSTCREDEKTKSSKKSEECDKLDVFLNAIAVPAQMPTENPKPRAQMVQYVKTMSDYFCPKGTAVGPLDEACTAAETEHAAHKNDCGQKQSAFESAFCQWRIELSDACSALSTCHSSASTIYSDYVTESQTNVAKWKTEYKALKKILCYVEVWLKDGNVKTVDANQFKECDDQTIDDSPMNVDFGTAAAAAACSTTPVEKYPGTDGFKTTEYASFDDLVDPVTACLALPAAGTQPTLPATGTKE